MNIRKARKLRPGDAVRMKDWIPVRRGVILTGPRLENKKLYFTVRLDDGEVLEAVHLMFQQQNEAIMILNLDQISEYLESVRAFADKVGLRENFERSLDRLQTSVHGRPARVRLYKDFAPYSFEFVKEYRAESGEWVTYYNGGLIYHGPHDRGGDGSAPTFSVNLSPSDGWSIHT
jgi:hypothetical protein